MNAASQFFTCLGSKRNNPGRLWTFLSLQNKVSWLVRIKVSETIAINWSQTDLGANQILQPFFKRNAIGLNYVVACLGSRELVRRSLSLQNKVGWSGLRLVRR